MRVKNCNTNSARLKTYLSANKGIKEGALTDIRETYVENIKELELERANR